METLFDVLSVLLFIATAGLFFLRFRHENPPLAPYLAVCLACAVGNYLGNNGQAAVAISMLVTGAFLALHLAGEPYRDEPEEQA